MQYSVVNVPQVDRSVVLRVRRRPGSAASVNTVLDGAIKKGDIA